MSGKEIHVKKLIALALSVSSVALIGAAMAATPASASVFCSTAPTNHICPSTSKYPDGTAFKAKNSTNILLKLGLAEFNCTESLVEGSIKSGTVALSNFKLARCTGPGGFATTETFTPSYWTFPWAEGTHNAANGVGHSEWKISYAGTTCWYWIPTNGISLTGGSNPTMTLSSKMEKLSGGFLCANPGEMIAQYTISTPKPLYIEKE
jgi:hypothetical protein